jgi:hypothetical protein
MAKFLKLTMTDTLRRRQRTVHVNLDLLSPPPLHNSLISQSVTQSFGARQGGMIE